MTITHFLRGSSRIALAAVSALFVTTAAQADVTAECNVNPAATSSLECGPQAQALDHATAIGSFATADGKNATAVGTLSYAHGDDSVGVGTGAYAIGEQGVAVGTSAFVRSAVEGGGGIAIGYGAVSTSADAPYDFVDVPRLSVVGSVAIGQETRINGNNNVALGGQTLIGILDSDRSFSNSTAIGAFATVSANSGTALGAKSKVTAQGGLAIGTGVTVGGVGTTLINSAGETSLSATGINSAFVADRSIAIGRGSVTAQVDSIVLGVSSAVNEGNGIGVIPSAFPEVTPAGSVVLGNNALSNGVNNLVVGNYALASGSYDPVANTIPVVSYATAVGTDAVVKASRGVALGHGALVTTANSVAIGTGSVANEDNSVSFGTIGHERRLTNVAAGINTTDAVNMSQFNALSSLVYSGAIATQQQINNAVARTDYIEINSGEGSVKPRATGRNAIAIGSGAVADSASAVAMGDGAQATGGKSVAIGAGNLASGDGAVAIGDPNSASGTGAVAMGKDNVATGDGAVALGNTSSAQGDGSVAIGNQANAGASSIAIGNGAQAGPAGSVAIGNGAQATRYDEVALGSSRSSYTFAGLAASGEGAPSAAFMTVDARGQISRSTVTPSDLVNLQGQLANLSAKTSGLSTQIDTLSGRVSAVSGRVATLEKQAKQANGGIAAAMAIGNAFLPEGQKLAISFNLATYRGEQGFSGSIVTRVSDRIWLSGGVAGSSVRGSTGGRAGITFGW
jgi:hypothetical protein